MRACPRPVILGAPLMLIGAPLVILGAPLVILGAPLVIRGAPLVSALLVAVLVAGCVQRDGTRYNPVDTLVGEVSEEDERETGLEVDREIQHQLPMIRDPVVLRFVNDLGLALVAGIDEQPFVYRFRVVESSTLNAFATTGGYVYLHSALILRAGSVDELAGVVGHEIAHISKHHYARMRKAAQLPDLLSNVVGLGAAIATQQPAILYGVAGANVAMKLRYSRGLEAEADEVGSVYVARTGLDPAGSTRFFERLLGERPDGFDQVPPYLYSHPELEKRIAGRRHAAESLHPIGDRDPSWDRRFQQIRTRLAWLIETDRTHLVVQPVWRPNASREEELDVEALEIAQLREPHQAFRLGEQQLELGRYDTAILALNRTVELDPTRAAVFYQLGLAYKGAGDRARAVHALDEAVRLSGGRAGVGQRAAWELAKLDFGVIRESGFADGDLDPGKQQQEKSEEGQGERGASPHQRLRTPAGRARDVFSTRDTKMAWWSRIAPQFVDYADEITIRWTTPDGEVVYEGPGRRSGRVYLSSILERENGPLAGDWKVEAILDGDVVSRSFVRIGGAIGSGDDS